MSSARYSGQIFNGNLVSRYIAEKYSNTKFYENPSGGSRVVACGQTYIHEEANIRIS
jgi:hypothetical protein